MYSSKNDKQKQRSLQNNYLEVMPYRLLDINITPLFPRTDQHFLTAKYFLQLEEQRFRWKLHKNNSCVLFKIEIQVLSTFMNYLCQYLTFFLLNFFVLYFRLYLIILKTLFWNKAMKEQPKKPSENTQV